MANLRGLNAFAALILAFGFAGFSAVQFPSVLIIVFIASFACHFSVLSLPLPSEAQQESRHKQAEGLAGIGLVVFLGLLFAIGLLPALMALLFSAQLALSVRADHNNRYYSALLIGLVSLLAGAAETKSEGYLLFFAGFGFSACLLLRGLYLLPFIQGERSPSPKKTGVKPTFGLRLGISLLMLTTLVYFLIPRFPAGNIGASTGNSQHFYENKNWPEPAEQNSPQDQSDPSPLDHSSNQANQPTDSQQTQDSSSNGYQGFNDSFDINKVRDSNAGSASNGLIARVRADLPLYLKTRVFDKFDGARWQQSSPLQKITELKRGEFEFENNPALIPPNFRKIPTQYEVTIESPLTRHIPFAEALTALQFPAAALAQDGFGQWSAPAPLRAGTVYGAKANLWVHNGRLFSEATLKAAPVAAASAEAQKLLDQEAEKDRRERITAFKAFLQIPSSSDPRIYQMARDITRNHRNEIDKAIALETHLRTQYEYSFESIFASQGYTPLGEFLFETRKGHCEYFASALVMLLRSIDIPARLVTGLLAHNQNPVTGFYEVHSLDGHAWVEAYVDDKGWMLLEPTAYYPMPEASEPSTELTAEKIKQYIENLERLDEQAGSGEFSLKSLLRSVWYTLTFAVTILVATVKLIVIELWWLWLGALVLAVIAYFVWVRLGGHIKNQLLLKRAQKAQTLPTSISIEWIHQALKNKGERLPKGLTFEAFSHAVAKSSLNSDEKTQLIGYFNRSVYGDGSLAASEKDKLEVLSYRVLIGVLKQ